MTAYGKLEQQIGCMIMTGFRGLVINDQDALAQDLRQGRIGGVVLFDTDAELKSPVRNIASPRQLYSLISDIKKRSPHPLLIGVDQEGGKVVRLKPSHGFPETVSQRFLGQTDDPDLTLRMAESIAETLADAGFNLNFSPLVDLDINPESPAIGHFERSFSADPEVVIRHGQIFIQTLMKKGITPVLKHFPGHGSAGTDSHLGLVNVTESWDEKELVPYRRLIRTGLAPMIMSAHIFNQRLDPKYPATLSKNVITDLLRNELGYNGVIISDDLNMKAISDQFGLEKTVELAIKAGIDILLFGNNLSYDPDIASKVHRIILDLLRQKRITKERIATSVQRIEAIHHIKTD